MGKAGALPKEARALNSPEDYYQAKQQQQAKYNATMQGDGGMAAKSAPRGVGSYDNVMNYLAQGQAGAEGKYGYKLDSFGHRTTAPPAPPKPVAAPAAPVVAPVVTAPVAAALPTTLAPVPPTLSPAEVKVADAKATELTSQQQQQVALDAEAKRREDAAKRRGRGISSFLTTGFQGVQQSALAKLLGA